MEQNAQAALREDENAFSIKDFFLTCLSQWKWFVISIIFFVGIGILYVIRQQPVYTRTVSLLIQDNEGGSGLDVPGAFKSLGLGGGNTNVFNELISLRSPAVMFEVVERLNLNVDMMEKKYPHSKTLYGTSAPLNAVYPDVQPWTNISMRMTLHPDDSYTIGKFVYTDKEGNLIKDKDAVVKGKLGFADVKTPAGTFVLRPNGTYTNNRKEDMEIVISVVSIKAAVEHYTAELQGGLADQDADVIDLTIDNVNTQRATDILNTVVDVYNEFWVRDKNRMAVATSNFIDERLNRIIEELGEVDSDIAQYQSENLIPDLEATSKMYLDESSFVSKDILSISNELAMAKFIRDYISNPSNENAVVPINTGMGSNALENMIRDYNTILLNRNNLRDNSGADNPIVGDYDRQVKGMRESLLKSVNQQVGSLEANLKSLEKAQGENKSQLAAAPAQAKYLGTIKRDQTVKESLYLYLLERREENNLTQAFNAYNTRIITPPYGPSEPIAPKKGVTIIICFVLGVLVPAAVLYFVMISDTKVRNRRDMENLPIPFTGEIPQVGRKKHLRKLLQSKKKRQREIDTPKPIVAEGKRDVPNEAFRVVRSNIDLMLGSETKDPVLMVTSFNPGSGKSFVCYNLGASFALKRKRVLLIDGDLRHGSLSTYVGSPHRGMSAFLTGKENNPERIIYPVEGLNGLSIVPIGKRPPNPAELLEGNRFGEFLDAVRDQYDIIMVDCPPVNIVVDTQLLNRYADATIFVVRAGLLDKSAIKDLTTLYNDKKLKRMSILLNGTESAHSSYYTYGNYQSLED